MGRTTNAGKPARRTAMRRSTKSVSRPHKAPAHRTDAHQRQRVVSAFYDELADGYDAMTDFEHRFQREGQLLRMLVAKNGITRALDAGTGTGFHALMLAKLDVHVTAVDVSPKMIRHLVEHARAMHVKIEAVRAGFKGLARKLHKKFDLIVCMGNTLTHMRSAEELGATLKEFSRLLHPGGFLVAQVLNFDRLLEGGAMPQNIRQTPLGTFIRTYQLTGSGIRLTVEHRQPGEDKGAHRSLDLRPVYQNELEWLLEKNGFAEIETFGNMEMEPFDPTASKDIVVVARV